MIRTTIFLAFTLSACQTADVFVPKSDFPPRPWVKGYADPEDCLGGERLAAINIPAPDYPRKAWNRGVQGWAIVRLDVSEAGRTENVGIERAVPAGYFEGATVGTVEDWRFQPPGENGLQSCRVLITYRLGSVAIGG